MNLADSSLSLETDIRKLKLELMRQELDDKMLTLKLYLERQRQLNSTTIQTTTTTEDPSEMLQLNPFGSVLYINVVGDFLVWHFVVLTIFIWVLIIYLIKCTCRLMNIIRVKRRIRNSIKLKKELKNSMRAKNRKLVKPELANKEKESTQTVASIEKKAKEPDESDTKIIQNHTVDYFLPPKRDFFLYTIHEHEKHAKKVFTFKRRDHLYSSKSHLLNLSKTLSKSDSNLFKIKTKNFLT